MSIWSFFKNIRVVNQGDLDRIAQEKAIDIISGELSGFSASGTWVNYRTGMRNSTVYRCVAILAGSLGSLPCEVYERLSAREKQLARQHPVFQLVHDSPNAKLTAAVFWETLGLDYFLSGNAYALIGRNRNGDPEEILWIPGSSVTPKDSPDYRRIWYDISMPRRRHVTVDQDDVLHFPNLGWGLEENKSRAPLECARDAIGLSIAQTEYSAKYFKDGVSSNFALSYPNKIDEQQLKLLKDHLRKRQGGLKNSHQPLILTEGGEAKNLNHSPEASQLIESRTFQAEEICRIFGVPPPMAGILSKSTSWGSGIAEQALWFAKFSLRHHIKKFEQEVNRKLLRDSRFFTKFNMDALLRADPKGRAEFYKVALGGTQSPAYMTPNEVREKEGLPPIEGGDELAKPKDHQGTENDDTETMDPADPRRWMKGAEDEK